MKSLILTLSVRPLCRLLALAVVVMAVSSCRTTEGLGRDMQHLGNKIEQSAERHL